MLAVDFRIWIFKLFVDNCFQGNGAVQKGMPFKHYHGKTGRIYNVTQHAVGVKVNKRVRLVYYYALLVVP